MSRFLISCGGTGGHLSPGIAVAEGLLERGHQVRLLISDKRVDSRLVEKYPHLAFIRVPGTGFSWRPLRFARFVASQLRGVSHCCGLVRNFRPDGIVGFGGFSSVPVVLAGRLFGVPIALHEANRVPGRAIRMLGPLVDRVYLPPGIRLGRIRATVTRQVGLPVRREIFRRPVTEARQVLGLDPERPVLVVLGGSQGSGALNDWTRSHLGDLAAAGIQLFCVTGLGKGEPNAEVRRDAAGHAVSMVFAPFSDQVADLLSAADLVVSRAGAGTIAELIRCATPAILVPFPHAADDHQRANAAFFERQGGGFVVLQDGLANLWNEVRTVILNPWLLRQFRSNLERMDRANSLQWMLEDLEDIICGGSGDALPAPA